MRAFTEGLKKPFMSRYNAQTNSIWIDRPVKRTWGNPLEDEV